MKLYPIRIATTQGVDFIAMTRDELIFKAHAHTICRAQCIEMSATVHDFANVCEDLVAHAIEGGQAKPRLVSMSGMTEEMLLIEKITRKDFFGNTRPIDSSFLRKLTSGTLSIYVDTASGHTKVKL